MSPTYSNNQPGQPEDSNLNYTSNQLFYVRQLETKLAGLEARIVQLERVLFVNYVVSGVVSSDSTIIYPSITTELPGIKTVPVTTKLNTEKRPQMFTKEAVEKWLEQDSKKTQEKMEAPTTKQPDKMSEKEFNSLKVGDRVRAISKLDPLNNYTGVVDRWENKSIVVRRNDTKGWGANKDNWFVSYIIMTRNYTTFQRETPVITSPTPTSTTPDTTFRRPPIRVQPLQEDASIPSVAPGRSIATKTTSKSKSLGQLAAPKPFTGKRPPLPSWPRVKPGRA